MQQQLLSWYESNPSQWETFCEATRRLDSDLVSFTNNAGNLSYAQWTIRRANRLVAEDGKVAQLVPRVESSVNWAWKESDSPSSKPSTKRSVGKCDTCFVFHLPPTVDDDVLRTMFSKYGKIEKAWVSVDSSTGRTRGFGYVQYSSSAEAYAAIAGLNKYAIDNKYLSVSIKI